MRQPAAKFTIDIGWAGLLETLGIKTEDLLRHAGLPQGLLSQAAPQLDTEAYFRLWSSVEDLMDAPEIALTVGQALTPDGFSPPLFATFCSPNLKIALERLATYKPLVCPMTMTLAEEGGLVSLTLNMAGHWEMPTSFVLMENVFLVHLARMATRREIQPAKVILRSPPEAISLYRAFFGVSVSRGESNRIVFRKEDTLIPFLSVNNAMFDVFEPVLKKRLSELEHDATLSDRVRACLAEMLAGGQTGIGDVADRLAMSARTLQRKLSLEGTGFQEILNQVRRDVAKVYLTRTRYTNAEIAFLLGYDDPNSFVRAFHGWTGVTPDASRQAAIGK